MRTDDLITLLSTNVEPVQGRRVSRAIAVSIAAGAAIAVGAMLVALGVRPDLMNGSERFLSLAAKLTFALGIVGLAAGYLVRIVRPGGERRAPATLVLLPFIAIVALAALSLLSAPSSHWRAMVVGDAWLECLVSIPVIAVAPFALLVWAVRQAAPTDLARAGALTGLAAGGVSAAAYALHCMDDSLPFVALWYGGTVALCTIAGAALGPRLLRW